MSHRLVFRSWELNKTGEMSFPKSKEKGLEGSFAFQTLILSLVPKGRLELPRGNPH